MKKVIICFFMAFVSNIGVAQVDYGPKTLTRNDFYLSDNSWWRCDGDTKIRCLGGPLNLLGLSSDEEKYVRNTLNAIPFFPKKTTNAEISRIVGMSPVVNIDGQMQTYVFKHNTYNCTIIISIMDGSVVNVKWEVMGKFLLAKAKADCDKSGKCS